MAKFSFEPIARPPETMRLAEVSSGRSEAATLSSTQDDRPGSSASVACDTGAEPPSRLGEIYRSFLADEAMFALLLEERPAVVSFHFGLPPQDWIDRLKAAGIVLFTTATSLDEALRIEQAGIDVIVAQVVRQRVHGLRQQRREFRRPQARAVEAFGPPEQ